MGLRPRDSIGRVFFVGGCSVNVSRTVRRAFVASAVAAVVAGCSGPLGGSSLAGGSMLPSNVSDSVKPPLLYVSNQGDNTVDIFSYPKGKLEKKLTGFQSPDGLCSDTKGDVFVTSFSNKEIVEYAYGASKPTATLSDTNGYPDACAVDPKTGDLAVANHQGTSGPGNIAIYKNAAGKATIHILKGLQYVGYCGYDNKGDLFVDGTTVSTSGPNKQIFAELPFGSSAMEKITLKTQLGSGGAIQWDGQYLALADNLYQGTQTTAIYQVSVAGSVGTIHSTTVLTGSTSISQVWDHAGTIIGADAASVGFWKYPGTGSAFKTITTVNSAYGVTISQSKG